MGRKLSEMSPRLIGHVSALMLVLASVPVRADTVFSYAIDSAASVIHTSGGAGGSGIGDLGVAGTFDLRLFDSFDSSSIFENIVVSTSVSSAFEFPDFIGYDFLDSNSSLLQMGKESNPLGLPDNTYGALFDKFTHELSISGVYYEPAAEGVVYEYTIHTTIVPAPSTINLVTLGLVVLSGSRRKRTRLRT